MILSPLQLGLGVSDLLALAYQNSIAFSLVAVAVSGYVFLAVSARNTLLWKHTSPSERLLIGVAIGGGFEFVSFLSGVALLTSLGVSVYLDSIVAATSAASSVVLVVVSLGLRAADKTEQEVREALSDLTLVATYVFFILTMFFLGLLLLSPFYSNEVSGFFLPYLGSNFVLWYLSTFWTGVFYFIYTGLYKNRLHSYTLKPIHPRQSPFRRLRIEGRRMRVKFAVVGVIVLLFSAGAVVSDKETSLLTPAIQAMVVPNTLRIAFVGFTNVGYLMQILSTSRFYYQNSTLPYDCDARFFQPFNETIRISVPWSPSPYFSINNVTLPNPSDVSNYSLSSGTNFYGYSITSWQSLGVLNYNHTWISTSPKNGPVQSLNIGFANASRGSGIVVGLRYYQRAYPAVTCTEADYYYKRPNSTLVIHRFEIVNSGNVAIGIDSVVVRDFTGLNILPANVTMIVGGKPYQGFSTVGYGPYPYSTYTFFDRPIQPGSNLTMTIIGITKVP